MKRAIVLDTAGFLARIQLHIYGVELYTVPRVVEEVKDATSVEGLEISQLIERVAVVEPRREFVDRVKMLAQQVGSMHKLSSTDIDVAALALQLKSEGYEVTVVTDDYTLQNLLAHLGIKFMAIKYRGISEIRVFRIRKPSQA